MGQKYSYLFVCYGIWALFDVTMSEFSILLMSLLLPVMLTSCGSEVEQEAGSIGVGSSGLAEFGPFLYALQRWERLIFQAVALQLWRLEDAAEQPVNDSWNHFHCHQMHRCCLGGPVSRLCCQPLADGAGFCIIQPPPVNV